MKHVLVTGGAGGIGLAVAKRFIADGARVLVSDVDEAALGKARSDLPGLVAVRCDAGDIADIDELFRQLEAEFGALDVLVNNVGIGGPTLPTEQLPSEEWRRVLDVNLTSTFEVTRRAIPYLKRSAGTIINMSSAAGRFGYPNRIAYSVSKWGLIGFTKTLSIELGGDGISVNAILPGAVSGDRYDRVIAGRSQLSGQPIEEVIRASMANQSLPRLVGPEHVADLAFFLTTESGRMISGQALPIDADMQHG